MVNYGNGKVYKIESHLGDNIYIGSTTKEYLSQRMETHRGDYAKWKKGNNSKFVTAFNIFEEYGVKNCKMILLESVPCNSKDELTAREAYYIRNLDCVNKIIPGRTQQEYKETNKEILKEKSKLNYEKNKDKRKLYYERNKDRIQLYQKEYTEENKDKSKAYREANREKILVKKRQYYEANIEAIREKARLYHEANRQANRESLIEKSRLYREANRELLKEKARLSYQANGKEKAKLYYETKKNKKLLE